MKKRQNNTTRASTLQIALSTGLISISAILLAPATPINPQKAPGHDRKGFQLEEGAAADSITALGNYPDTSVPLSSDTTVMPDAAPTNTTSINVSTNSNFDGTFAASPTTGVVTVTDAHPAGTYTVTATAFGPGGTTTKTFALTIANGCTGTDSFTHASDANTGGAPRFVAIGDFNGDGKQDLAVANQFSNTVSIRLGDGLGGFSGSTEVGMSSFPISVAIGDFNGDGKQDLAIAKNGSATVSIRLGDGLGGFSSSTEIIVGSNPTSVAIGDFNRDGKLDLAVANAGSNTVSIRLGDGLGGFSGSINVSVGSSPQSVAIGDFNGDGKLDLAVATGSGISIRLGDGLGGFSGLTNVSVGSGPSSVAIGDFNGDGKQDLAVANEFSYTVSIRLGDGLGGFSGSTELAVGTFGGRPASVAIGDFNGDGKQDLAVANFGPGSQVPGTVSIRLGDGMGGFGGSTEVSVGYELYSVAIGDFNGDSKQDLAVADWSTYALILLGQCGPGPTPTPITISGTISDCSNPAPGPVPNVTLTLTGSASGSTLSDGSGNYQVSALPSGGTYTVRPTKAALPPGSTGINTVDVVATQRHFLTMGNPLTGCRLTAADVNGDSAVNTVDVVAIQRFFLGLSTGIANVGKYQFSPPSHTYIGIVSDQTAQNYDTLVFGDVTSPYVH